MSTLKDILDQLELDKTAAAENKQVGTNTQTTGEDYIYELLKEASAGDEAEMEKNAAAFGRIAFRAFLDEAEKLAAQLPEDVQAEVPPVAPVSSEDLAAAANAVATTAVMSEQNQEKEEQSMRIQAALATKDSSVVKQKADELLNSGDPEKRALGLALQARAKNRGM